MMGHEAKNNRSQFGFSFIELLIVTIILLILASVAVMNYTSMIGSINIEAITTSTVVAIRNVRRDALRGDITSKSYNATKDLFSYPLAQLTSQKLSGMEIKTVYPSNGCASCSGGLQPICISGEKYCYKPSVSEIEFVANTGRTLNHQVIFITSKSRQLAILITPEGHIDVAELKGGQWRTQSDLKRWN